SEHLYFYDAISPIVEAETIDRAKVYRGSRYGKAADDYLNCPMDREEYNAFYDALISAESVPIHEFEEACYFESCLPIEEIARRDAIRASSAPDSLLAPRGISKTSPQAS